jgi:hypothetical protein
MMICADYSREILAVREVACASCPSESSVHVSRPQYMAVWRFQLPPGQQGLVAAGAAAVEKRLPTECSNF